MYVIFNFEKSTSSEMRNLRLYNVYFEVGTLISVFCSTIRACEGSLNCGMYIR